MKLPPPPTPPRARPEALLERQILRAAGATDVALYRNEVGSGYPRSVGHMLAEALAPWPEAARVVAEVLARHRISWGLGVGSPDLVGAVGGEWLGLELKSERGRLRPEQEEWHAAARARGLRVEVVRSVEEVRAVVASVRAGRV